MEKRQSRKTRPKSSQKKVRKSHLGRKTLLVFTSIIVILGLIIAGVISVERYFVKHEMTAIVSKVVPTTIGTTGLTQLKAASPTEVAQKINTSAASLVSNSAGFVSSAKATASGNTVTVDLQTKKLNAVATSALLATNGDQAQTIANKVLDSMSQKGAQNPLLVIHLTDASGKTIKTLTYSK